MVRYSGMLDCRSQCRETFGILPSGHQLDDCIRQRLAINPPRFLLILERYLIEMKV